MGDELEVAPDDWEERKLCADGACLGTIDPDNGQCRVCGRGPAGVRASGPSDELDPRLRGLRSDEEAEQELEQHRVAHSTPTAPEDWEDRALCPDGSCIGVVGSDGHCSECGRASE